MPATLIAIVNVVVLWVAFSKTRRMNTAKKWGLRAAVVVLLLILGTPLAGGNPEVAAEAGEYTVYFGVVAAIPYFIANRRRFA